MSNYKNNTENFYREIISLLCNNVKEDFLFEGIDENVLADLKTVKKK